MANFPPRSGQMLAEVVQGGCGVSVLGDLQRPRAHSSLRPARGERAGAEGLAQRTSTGPFQPHPPVWLCALLLPWQRSPGTLCSILCCLRATMCWGLGATRSSMPEVKRVSVKVCYCYGQNLCLLALRSWGYGIFILSCDLCGGFFLWRVPFFSYFAFVGFGCGPLVCV